MGFWLFSFHVKLGVETKLFHVKHSHFILILAVFAGVLAYFSLAFVHYNTLLFSQTWRCFSLNFSFFCVDFTLEQLLYLDSLPTLQPHHKLILLILRLQLIPRRTFVFTINYTPCKCDLRLPLTVVPE